MKNHFFFSWSGNKRGEIPKIYDYIKNKLDDIDTVIEPFCGSCAVSVFMSITYPGRFKYILNDIDENLIMLLEIARDDVRLAELSREVTEIARTIDKEKYTILCRSKTFIGWVISNVIHCITPGRWNINYKSRDYDFAKCPIVTFLRGESVTLSSVDAVDLYRQYSNNKNVFIFLDPPYMAACNSFYDGKQNVNIYEHLFNNKISEDDSFSLLVLEKMWIVEMLFRDEIRYEYEKQYSMTKKKTSHVIISNR